MEHSNQATERPLDFLKIWHNVFAKKIQHAVEYGYVDPRLEPELIDDDHHCQLGQWLSAQDDSISSLQNFTHLARVHRRFHVVSAELARLQQKGCLSEAQSMLNKVFLDASQAVCVAIDALNNDLSERGFCRKRFPVANKSNHSIWDASYEIGIPKVDMQHRAIATLIDEVLVNGDIECSSGEGQKFLGVLSKMIKNDIRAEDDCISAMATIEQDFSAHRQAHETILKFLESIQAAITRKEIILFDEVGRYLANWYIDHLVVHDFELEGHH